MKRLVAELEKLKKSDCKLVIDSRIHLFQKVGQGREKTIFKELCFCLLTANFDAARAIKIQAEIGDGFLELSEIKLAKKLKELGYRFPNTRAGYIVKSRKHFGILKKQLKMDDAIARRKWFSDNVKGLGMKESSHFLRNIGFTDYAIIDFHIVDLLEREGLITRPKTLTPKRYVEIEGVLQKICDKTNLNQAKLDLYLWFMETGKILK